jgi:hypothetical protein
MVPLANCCLWGESALQNPERVVYRVYPLPLGLLESSPYRENSAKILI